MDGTDSEKEGLLLVTKVGIGGVSKERFDVTDSKEDGLLLGKNVGIGGVSKEKLKVGGLKLKSEEERGDCAFWRPKAVALKARSGELDSGNCEFKSRAPQGPQPRSFDPESILVGSSFKLIASRGIPFSRYRLDSLEWSSLAGKCNVHPAKKTQPKFYI